MFTPSINHGNLNNHNNAGTDWGGLDNDNVIFENEMGGINIGGANAVAVDLEVNPINVFNISSNDIVVGSIFGNNNEIKIELAKDSQLTLQNGVGTDDLNTNKSPLMKLTIGSHATFKSKLVDNLYYTIYNPTENAVELNGDNYDMLEYGFEFV